MKREDKTKHTDYRTQENILQIDTALGEAKVPPYKNLLNPPPADAACAHLPKP